MKWALSISREYWVYWTLLAKNLEISDFWVLVWGIETFHRSKFSPATGVTFLLLNLVGFSFHWNMYVSFIGLRLVKTKSTLINRTRLWTKGQSAGYPQKPKLKSLPILSSVSTLVNCRLGVLLSKDSPLQRCPKFTLVPVFYPSTEIHGCVLLSSRPLFSLMDPKTPTLTPVLRMW